MNNSTDTYDNPEPGYFVSKKFRDDLVRLSTYYAENYLPEGIEETDLATHKDYKNILPDVKKTIEDIIQKSTCMRPEWENYFIFRMSGITYEMEFIRMLALESVVMGYGARGLGIQN